MRPDAVAPDGSDVRVLLSVAGGSLAHFELGAGETSISVEHRTVEEVWYVVSGSGQIAIDGDIVSVRAGSSVLIPTATPFQFRAFGAGPLAAIGVTIPPWPGEGEATPVVGHWEPTVSTRHR